MECWLEFEFGVNRVRTWFPPRPAKGRIFSSLSHSLHAVGHRRFFFFAATKIILIAPIIIIMSHSNSASVITSDNSSSKRKNSEEAFATASSNKRMRSDQYCQHRSQAMATLLAFNQLELNQFISELFKQRGKALEKQMMNHAFAGIEGPPPLTPTTQQEEEDQDLDLQVQFEKDFKAAPGPKDDEEFLATMKDFYQSRWQVWSKRNTEQQQEWNQTAFSEWIDEFVEKKSRTQGLSQDDMKKRMYYTAKFYGLYKHNKVYRVRFMRKKKLEDFPTTSTLFHTSKHGVTLLGAVCNSLKSRMGLVSLRKNKERAPQPQLHHLLKTPPKGKLPADDLLEQFGTPELSPFSTPAFVRGSSSSSRKLFSHEESRTQLI